MSQKLILLSILAGAFIASCVGCGGSDDRDPQADIYVSVGPLAWLAEQIAQEHLTVATIIEPSQDPHTFAPTAKQVLALSAAKIFFTVNLPLEKVLASKIASSSSTLQVIDLTKGLDVIKHHPDHEHEHTHDNCCPAQIDPHVWMSPRLTMELASKMCEQFCKLKPECKNIFEANLALLTVKLIKLDQKLATILAPYKGREIFVFHPAFGYFARDFGLVQRAVETGGKTPSAKHITQLIAKAKAAGVKIIFVQPQFSTRSAEIIAKQIGGVVATFDPLEKNYIANLEHLAEILKDSLE